MEFTFGLGLFKLTYRDYPWDQLGDATIVDVGGGVGESYTAKEPAIMIHRADHLRRRVRHPAQQALPGIEIRNPGQRAGPRTSRARRLAERKPPGAR